MQLKQPYLLLILVIGCTQQPKSTNTVISSTLERTAVPQEAIPLQDSSETTHDEDCVFNNDVKGLTTEWLNKLNITNFIWRDDLKSAVIPEGIDTVLISKGGCMHYGTSVEIIVRSETPGLTDSVFWISKALLLAERYKMDDYVKFMKSGSLKKSGVSENSVSYDVFSDDDGYVYEGIQIRTEPDSKRLSMSQYFY